MTDDTQLYPPKRELLKQALTWERGSEHSLEEFADILGTTVGGPNFYNSIAWVDRELIEYGRKLENIRGKGYRLVMPEEHVRMSNQKVKQAKKFVRIGLLISSNVDRSAMTPKMQKITDEHTMRTSRLASMLETESKSLNELELQATPRLKSERPKMLLGNGE